MDGLDWLARLEEDRREQRPAAVATDLIICIQSNQPGQLVRPSVSCGRRPAGHLGEASRSSWRGWDKVTVGMCLAGLEDP